MNRTPKKKGGWQLKVSASKGGIPSSVFNCQLDKIYCNTCATQAKENMDHLTDWKNLSYYALSKHPLRPTLLFAVRNCQIGKTVAIPNASKDWQEILAVLVPTTGGRFNDAAPAAYY